jgi:hypothetical protein
MDKGITLLVLNIKVMYGNGNSSLQEYVISRSALSRKSTYCQFAHKQNLVNA